jgi:DNA gyrase subunit A
VVKKAATSEFSNAKTRGIIAIKLEEGDRLVSALLTSGKDEVVLISRQGQALRTHEDQVRVMGRASRGVSGIKLSGGDELAGLLRVDETGDKTTERMLIISEYGYGKRVDFTEFSAHGRATGGQKIYTVSDKTGEIVGCVNVLDSEEIMCITSQGKSIKLKVKGIRVMGRAAQGVRILNIDKPDFVVGVDRIVKDDDKVDEPEAAEDPSLVNESDQGNDAIVEPDQIDVDQEQDEIESSESSDDENSDDETGEQGELF